VFYMDVAKVDRDVAYVVMVVHVYYKRLFLVFHLFFQTYVARVFICMLHMFHTYVANILFGCCICLQWLQVYFQVFLQVYLTHVISISSIFIRMLQVLYLDVSKVERVSHLSPCLLLSRLVVSSSPSATLHPS
jgi:hypothetical protein